MSVGAALLAILRGKIGAKKNFARAARLAARCAQRGGGREAPLAFFLCLIAKILQNLKFSLSL